jgi:hypothetical protein
MIVAAPASDSTEAVLSRKRLAATIPARDEARRQERSCGSSATCWPGWRQSMPTRNQHRHEGDDRIGDVRSRAFACCEGG